MSHIYCNITQKRVLAGVAMTGLNKMNSEEFLYYLLTLLEFFIAYEKKRRYDKVQHKLEQAIIQK